MFIKFSINKCNELLPKYLGKVIMYILPSGTSSTMQSIGSPKKVERLTIMDAIKMKATVSLVVNDITILLAFGLSKPSHAFTGVSAANTLIF